jgi:lipid II:glycine glycyltransferase (peptidoglycan interpeptide bridge formation enzyme)
MAIIIDRSFLNFKKRDIFLSEFPYDIDDKFDVVRFKYCKNRINLPGYTCEEKLTSTIDLQQESEEIWKKMNRKLRQKIKKATKENINWKINENFDEFYSISKDFVKQKKFSPRIGAFLGLDIPTVKIMKKYGTLFTAELNGEILSGHLYLEDKENILAWISTSKRLAVNKETANLINHANCLLHWQAINYAKEKSIRTFNWGGISRDPKKNSINTYKLSFGGQIEPSYFYSKVNNKFYEKLSSLNLWIFRSRYSSEIEETIPSN